MPRSSLPDTTETRAAESADTAVKKKRVRLPPEMRRQQILDAALVEFSANGFGGASMAMIAKRADTSKANVFQHFGNKEAIFEALLKDVLDPAKATWGEIGLDDSIEKRIDEFVDARYVLDSKMIQTLRLMIAEGHRVPALMESWYAETFLPAHVARQKSIDRLVKRGELKPSPLTENISLLTAPLLYAAVFKLLLPEHISADVVQSIKKTHRKFLKAYLQRP